MKLKNLFPLSYKKSFLIAILWYVVVAVVATALIVFAGSITGWIPVVGAIVGWALRIIGAFIDLYVLIGVVLAILVWLKIVK